VTYISLCKQRNEWENPMGSTRDARNKVESTLLNDALISSDLKRPYLQPRIVVRLVSIEWKRHESIEVVV
jgi:hypothetical protein